MLMETIDESKIPPIPETEENVPPIPGAEPQRRGSKKVWWLVAIAAAVLAVVLALVLTKGDKKSDVDQERHVSMAQSDEPDIQQNVTVRTYTGAEADSMMRAEMAHMDSIMNEMMNDPFFTGGMGGMLDPFQPPTSSAGNAQPPVTERKAKKSAGGIVIFAGNVGGRGLEMKLDLRDPQNVSGSGKWDDGTQLKMLGIGNASELDVTLYQGTKLLGTLSGTWLGESYRGVYLQDGKESRFSLVVQ